MFLVNSMEICIFFSLDGWCPINIAIKNMVHSYPVYGKDYRPGYMDNIWIYNPVYIIYG